MRSDQNKDNNLELTSQNPISEQVVDLSKTAEVQTPAQTEVQLPISTAPQQVSISSNQPPISQTTVAPQSTVTTPKTSMIDPDLINIPAENVDVIEKEWVEKADEIEERDKDDPYKEDEDQHNLSRAYLKKRFNLDVQ